MSWLQQAVIVCASLAIFSGCNVRAKSIRDNEIAYEDGCLVSGVKHKVGESWSGPVGDCTVYTCTGHDGSYSAKTCASVAVRPESGCFIVPGNNMARYPQCCPRAVCPLAYRPRNH